MSTRRRPERKAPPRRAVDVAMLTREDIGYGPARPYEFGFGPEMPPPREKRRASRHRREEAAPPGAGPYHERLRRRFRPDPWIRAEVEETLFLDTWIDADRITVMVEGGVVSLIGMLQDGREVHRAVRDAASVPGVRDVQNRLEVET